MQGFRVWNSRQREIKHTRSPCPEIRGAGCHRIQILRQNPEQQGTCAPFGQSLPSIIEPGQQITETLGPMFQAHELRGSAMRVRAQPLKQILRADPDIPINGYTHCRMQSLFQKTSRLVPIEAVGVGQETQRKRLPALQESLQPKESSGML